MLHNHYDIVNFVFENKLTINEPKQQPKSNNSEEGAKSFS